MRQFIDLVEQSLSEGGITTAPLDRAERVGSKQKARADFIPELLAVIEGKTLKDAVKAMVSAAAKDIRKSYNYYSNDELIEKIRTDRYMTSDYRDTLRRYFFDEWPENDHPEKMQRLFIGLLIKEMQRS